PPLAGAVSESLARRGHQVRALARAAWPRAPPRSPLVAPVHPLLPRREHVERVALRRAPAPDAARLAALPSRTLDPPRPHPPPRVRARAARGRRARRLPRPQPAAGIDRGMNGWLARRTAWLAAGQLVVRGAPLVAVLVLVRSLPGPAWDQLALL